MINKRAANLRRKIRIRAKVIGAAERPRLAVFRSARHIYVQLIDDSAGRTLAALNDQKIAGAKIKTKNRKTVDAETVGKTMGAEILKNGYNKIMFDRGGYKYHGRVKALAEGLRKAGLDF